MEFDEILGHISVCSSEQLNEITKFIKQERDKRYFQKRKDDMNAHIKKIKGYRLGHKLVVKRTFDDDVKAGDMCKLHRKKGARTRIAVKINRTGEVWNIPISDLDDPTEQVLGDIKVHERMGQLGDLFS